MSKLSSRIYAAMKQADMSYGELSHMTGIPKSALQRYATGETEKCPLNRIEAIAKATNVSTAYLVGWENDFEEQKEADSMFWKVLINLCVQNHTTPSAVCASLGLSNAAASKWKRGAIPNDTTIKKIADHFNVSVDRLLGQTDIKKAYVNDMGFDDISDPDFQRIKRAWECMSSKEKRKMVQILELTFEEYFDDADEDVIATIQSKCAEMQELASEISALASELG